MAGAVEFGVRVPNSGPLASIENIVRAARAAEEFGFDSVWVHDHVIWSSQMHRHHISSGSTHAIAEDQTADFYEALTVLSYLAAQTSRVKLGIACLVMPMRNPIYAAKQIATLDHLNGGRTVVGVGLGSRATEGSREFEVFGVPFGDRSSLTDEYIDVMKALWTQPLANHAGKAVQFVDAEMFPKPAQSPYPPVWIGGWTTKAAERAGRIGDGWIPGWLSPAEMTEGRLVLERSAQNHDRDASEITIAVEKLTSIAKDRDGAIERAVPTIRASSKTYERDVDDIQFALDRHIVGSVDDVRLRIREFIESGVRHFELKLIYSSMDEMEEQMQLWAETITPEFR